MNSMKKILLVAATISLVGCGLDAMGGGKNLKITDPTSLARAKEFAIKLQAEDQKIMQDKTYHECDAAFVQQAQAEMGALDDFYYEKRKIMEKVRKQQADNVLITGIAAMACMASDECAEEFADNGIQAVQEMHSIVDDKIMRDNGVAAFLKQEPLIKKRAEAAEKRLASCQVRMKKLTQRYNDLADQLYLACMNENWYGLYRDESKREACSNFEPQEILQNNL